jgi:hypothetical protein
MTGSNYLNISAASKFVMPFQHFLVPGVLSEKVSLAALEWLERDAPWKLVHADFYDQYEFDLIDARLPDGLHFLNQPWFADQLRADVEGLFSVKLDSRIDVTAHKLITGQRIRIHNDYIPGGETHRLLIQLNRGWRNEDGGLLLFFKSPNPEDVHRVICPVHNNAIGFAISRSSHHAVSTIHAGERFTLVYSFYQK